MTDKRIVIRAGRTFVEGSFRPAAIVVEIARIADIIGPRGRVAHATRRSAR